MVLVILSYKTVELGEVTGLSVWPSEVLGVNDLSAVQKYKM